jgi:3-oxoadipate enol-lactonase
MEKTIDGVRMAFDEAGSGEVVVLLHGFALDRTIWDAQFAALARICRVIRVDLRGSGQSGPGSGPALMETLAGDVFGLLEALRVDRAIIAGHSMGGYVALAFFRMYAERVAGLALIASRVHADPPDRRPQRDAMIAGLTGRGIGVVEEELLPRLFCPASLARDPGMVDGVRAIIARQDPGQAAAQVIGMKERVSSEDLLDDIRVPTLIFAGEADAMIPIAAARASAAALSDCTFVRQPACGHMPMLEAPAATTAALEELVRRCALNAATDRRSAPASRA